MKDPSASVIELLSFVIGVLGFAASGYFYLRSKEMPKPVWRAGGIPLIGSNSSLLPADVDVRYRNNSVQSLAKTYIAFWNAGRKTILGSDIVGADPIRFFLTKERRVLDARIIRRSREVNQAAVTYHDGEMWLTFDFLDQRDGVTLEVIHTGIDTDIKCTGTIKGIPRGIKKIGRANMSSKSTNALVPIILQSPSKVGSIALSASAIIAGVAGIVFLAINRPKSPRGPVPNLDKSYKQYLSQRPNSYKAYVADVQKYHFQAFPPFGTIIVAIGVSALVVALVITLSLFIRLRLQLPASLSLKREDMSDRPADDILSDRPADDMLA